MGKGSDLKSLFGGGSSADADAGDEPESLAIELGSEPALGEDDEEADAPPPDFALNAAEAFPDLAGDDARIDALYRTIKSCHPGI